MPAQSLLNKVPKKKRSEAKKKFDSTVKGIIKKGEPEPLAYAVATKQMKTKYHIKESMIKRMNETCPECGATREYDPEKEKFVCDECGNEDVVSEMTVSGDVAVPKLKMGKMRTRKMRKGKMMGFKEFREEFIREHDSDIRRYRDGFMWGKDDDARTGESNKFYYYGRVDGDKEIYDSYYEGYRKRLADNNIVPSVVTEQEYADGFACSEYIIEGDPDWMMGFNAGASGKFDNWHDAWNSKFGVEEARVYTKPTSGTMAGWTYELEGDGTLKKAITIGNTTFPKGTTVSSLPGGVFLNYEGVKHDRSVGSQWNEKYGQGVTRSEENLKKIAGAL